MSGLADGSGGGENEFSQLLERARGGDAQAAGELYQRHAHRVLTIVRRRLPVALRAKYDSMDLAQSVFAEMLRDLPRIEDRGERAFVSLLAAKASGKIAMKLRHHLGRSGQHAERRLATDAEPADSASEAPLKAERDDELAKLEHVVEGLDETSRRVLRMRAVRRSFASIADELGLASPDAARKRYARALVELRERWKDRPAEAAPSAAFSTASHSARVERPSERRPATP
jgi:RNA polymerase sigma factor (sigma-70 family)